MTRRRSQLVSVTLLAIGCAAPDSRPAPDAVDASLAPELWTVSPSPALEIGVVDGDEAYQLHDVGAATRRPDGSLLVADAGAGTLRLFGSDGELRRIVARAGSAPGELRRPTGLALDAEGGVRVWDADAWWLSSFTAEGTFVEALNLSSRLVAELSQPPLYPTAVTPLAGGGLLVRLEDKGGGKGMRVKSAAEAPGARREGAVVGTDRDLARVDRLGTVLGTGTVSVDSPWGSLEVVPPLAAGPHWATQPGGTRACLGDASEPSVRCYRAYRDEQVVRWRADPLPLKPGDADLEAWRAQAIENYALKLSRDDARRLVDAIPLPEYRPPYAGLHLDREGNLWVDLGPGAAGRRYLVFDAAGALVTHVRSPALRILEIGGDYLIGVREDGFGVQFLGVYPLTKPGEAVRTR